MVARRIIVPGAMPSRDANGRNLPALLRFYAPDATFTTPKAVYTDDTLTTLHPFPLPSDSAGRWPSIWAEEGELFDVGWSDKTFDATIQAFTNVEPSAAVTMLADLEEAVEDVEASALAAAESETNAALSEAAAEDSADDAEAAKIAAQTAQTASEDARDDAQDASTAAQGAANFVLTALSLFATSGSSLSVSTGSKTVHTNETGRGFAVNDLVVLERRSDPEVRMFGTVTASDGSDDYTVNVTEVIGAGGPYTDWFMISGALLIPGATAAEVLAFASSLVNITPKAMGDALAFKDDGTGSGTYTPDLAQGGSHLRIANGNSTLAAPTGGKPGQGIFFSLAQDATGGRTWSVNSGYKFVEGRKTFSTAANAIDVVSGVLVTTSPFLAFVSLSRNLS